MNFKHGWINLTRACNLRCKWCYARDTKYHECDTMDVKTVCHIIDIAVLLNLRHVTLIGGEPTVYPRLFEVLSYAKEKGINCSFVSNGVRYNDIEYVKNLYELGMNRFSISIKGFDKASFKDVAQFDEFDNVINGIKNCLSVGGVVIAFLVLTKENVSSYIDLVSYLVSIGVTRFHIGFLYNFNSSPEYTDYLDETRPDLVIKSFKESYPKLLELTQGKVKISPTFPSCAWGEDFINLLNKNDNLSGSCQLREKNGLIFDTDGSVIPCNAMHEIKMGRLYSDFNNANELVNYYENENVKKIYEHYGKMPSERCNSCSSLELCRCCACQWTNYSLEMLLDYINKRG